MPKKTNFVVSEKDNVTTILQEGMEQGTTLDVTIGHTTQAIILRDAIRYGHKIAIKPIKTGEAVLKYGLPIGKATQDIKVGEHVHIHNIESTRGRGDLAKGR